MATQGTDYPTVGASSITIPANSASASIIVTPTADTTAEPNETVIFSITPNAGYLIGTGTATGTILNDDIGVSIAKINDLAEPSTDGKFRLTLSQTVGSNTVVSYSVGGSATSGSDFSALTGTATITAGSTTVDIMFPYWTTFIVEGNETVVVTLTGTNNVVTPTQVSDSATATITDNDFTIVSITANDANASETGSDPGQFTVSLSGGVVAPTGGLTVNFSLTGSTATSGTDYTVTGTATEGTDYVSLVPHQVTIPTGATSATITVNVLADTVWDNNETVVVTLNSVVSGVTSAITIAPSPDNSATVTIKDPTITIMDNHDPGWETVGFIQNTIAGYLDDYAYGGDSTSSFGRWTFDVMPGTYRVSVTWPDRPISPKATNAPFSVYDGTAADALLATVLVNQRGSNGHALPEQDVSEGGVWFQDLDNGTNGGIYTITGNRLTVEVTAPTWLDGFIIADAVRAERLLTLQGDAAGAAPASAGFELSDARLAPSFSVPSNRGPSPTSACRPRLSDVTVVLGQLPPDTLGLASAATRTIWLDNDGAGVGWQVNGRALRGTAPFGPVGNFDLLTVVAHELGHLLGYGDLDPLTHPDALMASQLPAGEEDA